MTAIQITLDSAQVEALLLHIKGKADHLEPVMAAIGHDITERVKLCFRDLQTPYGQAWKPLSPVTKFNRALRVGGRKRFDSNGKRISNSAYIASGKRTTKKFTDSYLSATPLNDMGHLKNSIHYTALSDGIEIGANVPYAAMMNFGGKKANFGHLWGDIPARQFMPTGGLPAEWEQSVINTINHYLGVV